MGGGWRPAISSAALLFFMNIFLQMRLSFSPTEARNVDRLVSCHCITLASLTHGPRYQGMLLYSLSIRSDMRRILTLNMPPTTGWARVRSRVWSLEQDFYSVASFPYFIIFHQFLALKVVLDFLMQFLQRKNERKESPIVFEECIPSVGW